MIKVQIRMIRITKKVILTGKLVVEGTSYVFEFKTFEVKIPVDDEYPDILDYMDSIEVTDYSKNNFPEIGSRKIVTKNHWKNDHIKTANPARSAAFSVYMSVKNTLLSEFFSEALVILVKKLVNLFHDLLHNIHP